MTEKDISLYWVCLANFKLVLYIAAVFGLGVFVGMRMRRSRGNDFPRSGVSTHVPPTSRPSMAPEYSQAAEDYTQAAQQSAASDINDVQQRFG
jgi:hypothetical protein